MRVRNGAHCNVLIAGVEVLHGCIHRPDSQLAANRLPWVQDRLIHHTLPDLSLKGVLPGSFNGVSGSHKTTKLVNPIPQLQVFPRHISLDFLLFLAVFSNQFVALAQQRLVALRSLMSGLQFLFKLSETRIALLKFLLQLPLLVLKLEQLLSRDNSALRRLATTDKSLLDGLNLTIQLSHLLAVVLRLLHI
ncbi:uncharacterized protein BDV17DRAFT_275089 [Aspergillus undulatus]|uniref:uncharacterized protein n=1 Tax=Aspergillus undulatus TaxID=1810928 RepID=UPI003CCD8D42